MSKLSPFFCKRISRTTDCSLLTEEYNSTYELVEYMVQNEKAELVKIIQNKLRIISYRLCELEGEK